jgi:hypothetical protein
MTIRPSSNSNAYTGAWDPSSPFDLAAPPKWPLRSFELPWIVVFGSPARRNHHSTCDRIPPAERIRRPPRQSPASHGLAASIIPPAAPTPRCPCLASCSSPTVLWSPTKPAARATRGRLPSWRPSTRALQKITRARRARRGATAARIGRKTRRFHGVFLLPFPAAARTTDRRAAAGGGGRAVGRPRLDHAATRSRASTRDTDRELGTNRERSLPSPRPKKKRRPRPIMRFHSSLHDFIFRYKRAVK